MAAETESPACPLEQCPVIRLVRVVAAQTLTRRHRAVSMPMGGNVFVALQAKCAALSLQQHPERGLVDVMAGTTITRGNGSMNHFPGRLALVTDGAELRSLGRHAEDPRLLRVLSFSRRDMAEEALVGLDRPVDNILQRLAPVAAGDAAIGHTGRAVRLSPIAQAKQTDE